MMMSGERVGIREAIIARKAKSMADTARPAVVRSLSHLAGRIEREKDSEIEDANYAHQIRHVARGLGRLGAKTHNIGPQQSNRLSDSNAGKDVEGRHRELEADVRRSYKARAKYRGRDRNDGGRDR